MCGLNLGLTRLLASGLGKKSNVRQGNIDLGRRRGFQVIPIRAEGRER